MTSPFGQCVKSLVHL